MGFCPFNSWDLHAFIHREIIIARHGLYTPERRLEGELPEREILLGEIYGPWANVGTHHGGKCHNILDISIHLHATYRFIDLLFIVI